MFRLQGPFHFQGYIYICVNAIHMYIYVYKVYGGCIGVNIGFIVINGFWALGVYGQGRLWGLFGAI